LEDSVCIPLSITTEWRHITDHDLERYYLGMVIDKTKLAALEEHILACVSCAERADDTQQNVDAMRAASLDFEEEVRHQVRGKPPGAIRKRTLLRGRDVLMVCPERIRLTEAHAIKARALSNLTTTLYSKTGAERPEACVENDKAAEDCAAAWIALQEHKAQHGC
jgi:hypothetical protein